MNADLKKEEGRCALCSSNRSDVHKLFANCQHDGACRNCLHRLFYAKTPLVQGAYQYPMLCFDENCQREISVKQAEMFCQTDEELETFKALNGLAKENQQTLGKEAWEDLKQGFDKVARSRDDWVGRFNFIPQILGGKGVDFCRECKQMVTASTGLVFRIGPNGGVVYVCFQCHEADKAVYRIVVSASPDGVLRLPRCNDQIIKLWQ